ncbi:MAG TPA: D-alanine--D-alanine ligase [Solirubrobacteraceae bacterium]|jgi:D-alanine-D-alanine ligase|nr:D-alanine--D-alanine ligase [Solirubrobacteraceae bacterium]
MTRVAVLKGGRSLERQVSLASGARVEDALERLGHDVAAIDVGGDLVAQLRRSEASVAFVALHGRGGEDGTVQELLEVLEIPYTGSGVHACMRCFDKVLTKYALREGGLPTPDWVSLSEIGFQDLGAADVLGGIAERLRFPLVVKPVSQGSSLGVKHAPTAAELPAALVGALSYGARVLLEHHIEGRELAVSLLARGDGDSDVEALPIVEALPRGPEYDFAARYEIGETDFVCPAELDDDVADRVREIALSAWRLMGARGFARVDMILGADGPTVLEVNPIPGLTETSLLPQAADAAGVSFDQVVERVLAEALAR